MSDNEDHETYGWIVMAGPIGGFVFIVVTLIVCYAKRWCCFACRSDVPRDFNEMSGPRIAEAYRTDVNMSIFKIMTGKQKVPPPPSPS